MKDFLGRELRVGDHVAYCVRSGSRMEQILARVTEVEGPRARVLPLSDPSRRARLYKDSRTGEEIKGDIYSKKNAYVWKYPGHREGQCTDFDECRQGYPQENPYLWHSGVKHDWVHEYRGEVRQVWLGQSKYIAWLGQ